MDKNTAKKILILVIVLAVGVVSYFLFFQNNENEPGGEVTIPDQPNSNFFPDSEPISDTEQEHPQLQEKFNIPALRQISENPVSGFIIFDKETVLEKNSTSTDEESVVSETVYRFVNRSNGNILETTSRNSTIKRLTNDTIPKTQRAYFSNSGDHVVYQYLNENDVVETIFISLITKDAPATTSDSFIEINKNKLPRNIEDIIISKENNVLYTRESGGFLSGFYFNVDNFVNQQKIFDLEKKELVFSWLDNNNFYAGTKPSLNQKNYLFKLSINDNDLKMVSDFNSGFSYLLSPETNSILYSENEGGLINVFKKDLSTNEVVDLKISTIVDEKCVWSKKEEDTAYCAVPLLTIGFGYPNIWYQGQVSFVDSLYKIDTNSGEKTALTGLSGEFDIINLQVSENDEYLSFINKKDLTLWSLDIKK